jgi:hypothetical protein
MAVMDKNKQLKIFNELNTLVVNNKKVITAIEQGKDINTNKAIKACMKSNNNLAVLLKEIIYDKGKNENFSFTKGNGMFTEDFMNGIFK